MDLDFQVTQYFLFLLDLCKDPKDVFECGSAECRLAQTWLEKLCLLGCDSLAERRLRNVFLSHLCACLNEGELRGPFLKLPADDKLDPETDFGSVGEPVFDCTLVKKLECAQGPDKESTKFVNCDKPNQGDKKKGEEEVVAAYMQEHIDYAGIFEEFSLHPLKSSKALPALTEPETLSTKPTTASPSTATVSGQQILHEDVHCLLDAISRELRGEAVPGSSEYLERELARYKDFIMNYSTLAYVVQQENSKPKLRSFLLLHLQNDLVKLLTDLRK